MTPLALEHRQHPARDADNTNDTSIKDFLVPSARITNPRDSSFLIQNCHDNRYQRYT